MKYLISRRLEEPGPEHLGLHNWPKVYLHEHTAKTTQENHSELAQTWTQSNNFREIWKCLSNHSPHPAWQNLKASAEKNGRNSPNPGIQSLCVWLKNTWWPASSPAPPYAGDVSRFSRRRYRSTTWLVMEPGIIITPNFFVWPEEVSRLFFPRFFSCILSLGVWVA